MLGGFSLGFAPYSDSFVYMHTHSKSPAPDGPLLLDGESLTCQQLVNHLRRSSRQLDLSTDAWSRIDQASAAFDDYVARGFRCYGINTGLGDLIEYTISDEAQKLFQRRLVLSHAVAMKDALPEDVSRAIVVLRLNCFAKGASGIKRDTVRSLLRIYNAGAYPEIYSSGSLGASGDLAPLSQLGAFLLGKGWGYLHKERLTATEVYKRLDLQPLVLDRKEGLCLINGTSAMVAIGILAVTRLSLAVEAFIVGMGLLIEAFELPCQFVQPSAFRLKAHPGADWIANHLSILMDQHAPHGTHGPILQLPYSIRCVPFVLGPLVESLRTAIRTLEIEANSANDNPLFVAADSSIYHGGHFHGHPVSVALDQLRVAAVHLSGIIDRQLEFLFDRHRGTRVHPFLSINPSDGHCGLEGAQYLATSLHAENKMLAHPFSSLTIPTNAGNQDYVSLGMQSALACQSMASNTFQVLAIYYAAATQALVLHARRSSSTSLTHVFRFVQEQYPFPYRDDVQVSDLLRPLATEHFLETCTQIVRSHVPGFSGVNG